MGLFVFSRKVFFDAHGRLNERCHQTDKCQFADERPVGWADCDSDRYSSVQDFALHCEVRWDS